MKKAYFFIFITYSVYCSSQNDSIFISPTNIDKYDFFLINKYPKKINDTAFSGIDTVDILYNGENLKSIITYKDGFKINQIAFYDNGNKHSLRQWKDKEVDGDYKLWYKNGQIKLDGALIKNGKEIGFNYKYFENGNLNYLNAEQEMSVEFYENGKIKSFGRYIKDTILCPKSGEEVIAREETIWYENGQLCSKTIYNCGKQKKRNFYNDTLVFEDYTIIGMEFYKVGKYIKNYPNGNPKIEGQYEDANTQQEANIKTGTWKYYNEEGILIKEKIYEKNVLLKTKEYPAVEVKQNKKKLG